MTIPSSNPKTSKEAQGLSRQKENPTHNNDFVAHCKEHTAFAKSVTPQNLKCACHQINGFLSITLASNLLQIHRTKNGKD